MSTAIAVPSQRRLLALMLVMVCLGLLICSYRVSHIDLFAFACLLIVWLTLHLCIGSRTVDIAGLTLVIVGMFGVTLTQYMVDTHGITFRKNNMYLIVNALKAYDQKHGHLPQHAIRDKQDKPLLSWRVMILPQLGYEDLYNQFRLNEPWNSPHNIQLIEHIPRVFQPVEVLERDSQLDRSVIKTRTRPGFTHIVALRGKGSVFDAQPPVAASQIDNNVLLLAEAGELVPWTKPEDVIVEDNAMAHWLNAYSSGRGYTVIGYLSGGAVNCSENEPSSMFLKDSFELLKRIQWKPR
jgi:Protein of unknown function (DUF1559)